MEDESVSAFHTTISLKLIGIDFTSNIFSPDSFSFDEAISSEIPFSEKVIIFSQFPMTILLGHGNRTTQSIQPPKQVRVCYFVVQKHMQVIQTKDGDYSWLMWDNHGCNPGSWI